jgi:hypothetical protein
MADYFTQLVVQQNIPSSLISPFEELLLSAILEHEQIDDEMYFFASEQVCDFPEVLRGDLQEALAASPQRSRLRAFAEKALAASNPEHSYFDLDLSACEFGSDAHLIVLQDIVRRSKGQLPYLTIAAAYTCSKMRPDGFGGMCIVITPSSIRFWSTYDVLQRFTARFEKTQAAKRAPPAPPPE